MPISAAYMSTTRSSAAVASGRPAPRYAPTGRGVGEHGDGFGGDLARSRRYRRHQLGEVGQQRRERRIAAALLNHLERVCEEATVAGATELGVLEPARGRGPWRSCSRCASRTSEPVVRACTTTNRRAALQATCRPSHRTIHRHRA
jgi:hypothetical protein